LAQEAKQRQLGYAVVDSNWRMDSSELIANFRVRKQTSCGRKLFKQTYTFATLFLANRTCVVEFEVLTPVTTKITVCWVVTSLIFVLLIGVSEEPAVSIIMVDWSHLNLWLWIRVVITSQLVAFIFKNSYVNTEGVVCPLLILYRTNLGTLF